MLVGILSDTHDRLPMIDAAFALFAEKGVEAFIHPGDFVAPFAMKRLLAGVEGHFRRKESALDHGTSPVSHAPLYATFGNNDGEREGLKKLMPALVDGPLHIDIGGRKILVHHFIDWCNPSEIARAEIIITGHTHEVVNRYEGGKLFLNPGECCGWVTGRCTVAILDTSGPSAEVFEL